jgi:hypothetical protein
MMVCYNKYDIHSVHHSSSWFFTYTFRKLDLFSSSGVKKGGRGFYLVGPNRVSVSKICLEMTKMVDNVQNNYIS